MKDRAPLSYRDLKAIQEGNRRNADVMDLLREVKRLRDLVALAHAAMSRVPMREFKLDADEMLAMFDAMAAEPAVQEFQRMEKKREEMEFRRRQAQDGIQAQAHRSGPESSQ